MDCEVGKFLQIYMNNFEIAFLKKHQINIETLLIGLDEAGRGSWAGPITVAGVILPTDYYNPAIKDSKLLTSKKREDLVTIITEIAIKYEVIFISAQTVDKINPKQATIKGFKKILARLQNQNYVALVDGENLSSVNCFQIIKGDQKSQSIAAASILAKVYRDRYLIELSKDYPQFKFAKNKGYGTRDHWKALEIHGPCPHHRYSYKPIIDALQTKIF